MAKNSATQSQDIINFIDKDNTPDTYQSNMPAMSPIIASSVAEPVKVAQTTVTNIIAPVVPQSSKPVDFIARSKTEKRYFRSGKQKLKHNLKLQMRK